MPEAGWYQDPQNPAQTRWWDGAQWTGHTHPSPAQPAGQTTGGVEAYHQPLAPEQPGAGQVSPPDMQAIAARVESKQEIEHGAAVNYTPPSLTEQATINNQQLRSTLHGTPGTMWTGFIGLLVSIISALITGVAGGILFALGLASGSGGLFLGIFLIGATIGQYWLSGSLTAYFFQKKGYGYNSKWNLVAGYIVAGLLFGLTMFVVSLLMGAVAGQSSKAGALLVLVIMLGLIPLYIFILGKMINLAVGWSRSTGKVITLISASLGVVGALIASFAIGAVLQQIKNAPRLEPQGQQQLEQLQPNAPSQEELQKQFKQQMQERGLTPDQQDQIIQQIEKQQTQ